MTVVTAGYEPFTEHQQRITEMHQRHIAQLQQVAARDLGRQLLGYELVPINGRPNAPLDWRRRNRPQLAGLPLDLCQRAIAAADALDAAVVASEQAEQRYETWAAQNRPSVELGNLKREEMTIEQRAARDRADEALDRMAIELAGAAQLAADARATIASIPQRRSEADAQYRAALASIESAERSAREALASIGLSE